MKSQKILLKLEESQEKVRNFYQSNEFCDAQLWSYVDVQRSLVKFKTQTYSLKCKYTVCNSKRSFHKVRVNSTMHSANPGLQVQSYKHCSKI